MNELLLAVTLYASFDESMRADRAGGDPTFSTRFTDPADKNRFHFQPGYPEKVFRIAPGKGISGGALEALDVLPNNGRIFFPAKGNIAFRKGGWGGAVSFWMNTNPTTSLKTSFCDPVQITEKGANNGGIWCDFTAPKPRRDMRMGIFPAVPEGKKGATEEDADAPLVRWPQVDFQAGDWHHVVLSWKNFDTGRPDAVASWYVDGKHVGDLKDRPIAMDWNIEKAGIYVAVNFVGLMDEFAVFNRPLTVAEIEALHRQPGLLNKK